MEPGHIICENSKRNIRNKVSGHFYSIKRAIDILKHISVGIAKVRMISQNILGDSRLSTKRDTVRNKEHTTAIVHAR